MARMLYGIVDHPTEWSYTSCASYPDPFNEVELDVLIADDQDAAWRIPAFWLGGASWSVRFTPRRAGAYRVITGCSNGQDQGLHEVADHLQVSANTAPHVGRFPACISPDRRTLEDAAGRPFFWLGDTWWMGLTSRLRWPEEFQHLTADRVSKGFTIIHIVAGLYPDMPGFDPRGANEAGFPWEAEYTRINPAYFDMADLRIQYLVESGLTPCIVGCWGYYLPLLGLEKTKRHWRYLVARWGAYPVVWCLAGEANMPYYLSDDKDGDRQRQHVGWTELARYVRSTDPYHRLITIHPTEIGRDQIEDDSLLDIDMLQTGHGGFFSVPNTVAKVSAEYQRTPATPVVVGEVSYEGIMHHTGAEIQRLTFWSAFLSGAAGFTYGANGIWQLNRRERPYGASPHGGTWGDTPWDEAYRLPGSAQLGLARRLLERYPWQRFEPHQEWVEPAGDPQHVGQPFVAGIPREVRITYLFDPVVPWSRSSYRILGIEPDVSYRAYWWDPASGEERAIGPIQPDADGCWTIPMSPTFTDWVLVLEKK